MPRPTWTHDQVVALAPDAAGLKAGQKLATAAKWAELGVEDRGLWGAIFGSGKKPYQVAVDFHGPAFRCSCPSRKFPCKHSLALALIYADHPAGFADGTPPDWAAEWWTQRAAREAKKAAPATPVDEATQQRRADASARRAASREQRVEEGVQELRVWLRDLVRQGLATADSSALRQWGQIAPRMVDAQAPGLARRVTRMINLIRRGTQHRARLLEEIAQLHLLLEAFIRRSELSEAERNDLRYQVGFTVPKEQVLAETPIEDRWWAVGRVVDEEEPIKSQRDWIYGELSGRTILLLSFAARNQSLPIEPMPGSGFEGEVCLYPGSAVQRGLVRESRSSLEGLPSLGSLESLVHLEETFSRNLLENPWTQTIGVALSDVSIELRDDTFFIIDGSNREATLARQVDGWELLALSAESSIELFGEWDGHEFRALSAKSAGGFVHLGHRPQVFQV